MNSYDQTTTEEKVTLVSTGYLTKALPDEWYEWDDNKLHMYCYDHAMSKYQWMSGEDLFLKIWWEAEDEFDPTDYHDWDFHNDERWWN